MDYDLHIMRDSVRKKAFVRSIAGGYCWSSGSEKEIDIFVSHYCNDFEDCTADILTHEILHLLLGEIIGKEANDKLDHIHKPVCVLDKATGTRKHKIEFVLKKRKQPIIIL